MTESYDEFYVLRSLGDDGVTPFYIANTDALMIETADDIAWEEDRNNAVTFVTDYKHKAMEMLRMVRKVYQAHPVKLCRVSVTRRY